MGQDKAWLDLGGITMIERILRELQRVTRDVTVIANDSSYARLTVPVIGDRHTGIGPLEAVRTALSHSAHYTVVLVGCDLPFVSAALFEHLLSLADGFEVVVPLSAAACPEPLCAVYSRPALPQVTALIQAGERKVSRLFDRVPTRFVPFGQLAGLPGADLFFENINSPEDYRRALRRLHTAPSPQKSDKS